MNTPDRERPLRFVPAPEEDEGPPVASGESPDPGGDKDRHGTDPEGQEFFRKLYGAAVLVALFVILVVVGMLVAGREIPGEVMVFLGALVAYLLFPLIFRILTDTPWSKISQENRQTLETIFRILLPILGFFAVRSMVIQLL